MLRLALAAAIAMIATEANARCAPSQNIYNFLKEKHKEKRVSTQLQSPIALLELWASKNGTGTILITTPGGTSCVGASGLSPGIADHIAAQPKGTEF